MAGNVPLKNMKSREYWSKVAVMYRSKSSHISMISILSYGDLIADVQDRRMMLNDLCSYVSIGLPLEILKHVWGAQTSFLNIPKFVISISKNETSWSFLAFSRKSSIISNNASESFWRTPNRLLAGFNGEQAATMLAIIFPHVARLLPLWGVPINRSANKFLQHRGF